MTKLNDFGEKIGGKARKDKSSLGSKKEERPPLPPAAKGFGEGWRKRYWIEKEQGGEYVVRDLKRFDRRGSPRRCSCPLSSRSEAESFARDVEVKRTMKLFKHLASGKIYLAHAREGGSPVFDRRRLTFDSVTAARQFLWSEEAADMLDNPPAVYGEQDMIKGHTTVDRVGPPCRDGDIEPGQFLTEFNIRGVEFGNWVSASGERQHLVNSTFDALCDLALILNLPRKAIGLDGELSLAFGSRGVGKNCASYYPSHAAICLTRNNGNGWIAHEWGHALDHHLGIKYGGAPKRDEKGVFKANEQGETSLSGMKAIPLAASVVDLSKNAKSFLEEAIWMDRMRSPKYWSTHSEMFARLFNTYVFDVGKNLGVTNSFLTIPCVNSEKFKPFPEGQEREQTNHKVRKFLSNI